MDPKHRHTILVVDDEPEVVKSVKHLLRRDYNVLGCTEAREGLKLLAQEEVHVVMTDQRMPDMTGVEFLHRVRGDHPEAIRLLFTGYADIRAVIDAINQGNVYRYIAKPWDPDELLTIVREASERYDLLVERKQLLEELQAKNKALEESNARLAQASQLKETFIQVASHELRTPLTVLLGLMWMGLHQADLTSNQRAWWERIDLAGQKLQHLVNQLTKMLSKGQFERPLQRQPTDLRQLMDECIEEVRLFSVLREQTLRVEASDDLGTLEVEAAKIRDCLNNLLLNAIKFTPAHGTITLSGRRPRPDQVALAVRDTGVGIPQREQPLIFDPFFTGFSSLNHSSGTFEFGARGLGLGLSLVREFAAMHGGSVDVVSEVGQGATFTLTLPDINASHAA